MKNRLTTYPRIAVLLCILALLFGLTMEARAGGGPTATPIPAPGENSVYPEPAAPTAVPVLPAGLQMKTHVAYAGNFKYGDWLPIWVELENQGADIES